MRNEHMRLVVVYHFFPHYRSGVISEILRCFPRARFYASASGVDNIPVYKFSEAEAFHAVRTFFLGKCVLQPAVIWIALTGRFDCIVFLADPNHCTTWVAAFISRLRRKRVIFWGHGLLSANRGIRNRVRATFFGLASCFYAYGYRAKLNALTFGQSASRIYVGFNSLNHQRQLPLRRALQAKHAESDCSADELKVLCVSRLTKACRYDLLLEAMHIAKQEHGQHISATIVGDGSERVHLEGLAASYGLDVVFIGPSYDEEVVSEYIYKADVTVSPGKVGLTAIHSLMFGTPVISHSSFEQQMPEVEAVVRGMTGDFFKHGDASDLALALVRFKTQFADRESARARCFAMVDSIYNPAKQVEVLENAIYGSPAGTGDDAFRLFSRSANA